MIYSINGRNYSMRSGLVVRSQCSRYYAWRNIIVQQGRHESVYTAAYNAQLALYAAVRHVPHTRYVEHGACNEERFNCTCLNYNYENCNLTDGGACVPRTVREVWASLAHCARGTHSCACAPRAVLCTPREQVACWIAARRRGGRCTAAGRCKAGLARPCLPGSEAGLMGAAAAGQDGAEIGGIGGRAGCGRGRKCGCVGRWW